MLEEKKLKIKETLRATKERHSKMNCRVFCVKIQENRLSHAKEEKLNRCFLEAKWLYNATVATDTLSLEDTSRVQVKVKDKFEIREITCLSSQMITSVVDSAKQNVFNLSKAKKKGLKVGKLRYKKECNEINLKQFNNTYSIKGKNKIRVQRIGILVVNGLEQINHCNHCGFESVDRDIHSANMMVLLSGYGTYRSLNTDAVNAEKMVGFLNNLSSLGVVVSTNSMEAHCL